MVISVLGIIYGTAGVMHGTFEILQGNTAPGGLVFNAIGPAQRLWEYATLHAFSIIPNHIAIGTAAIITGILFLMWAVFFVGKKHGPLIMLLCSLILFLAGGGFGSIFTGVFMSIIATRISKPLKWWRTHIPAGAGNVLAHAWPWIFILYVIVFLLAVATTIFWWPLKLLFDASTTYAIVLNIGPVTLGLMLLSTLAAFSHDTRIHSPGEGKPERDRN